MYPTIVTMIYDIRKMENIEGDNNRSVAGYIELAKNFILKLPYPLVIFMDTNEEEIYDALYKTRSSNNLLHLTHIYKLDFKETYFYKDLSKIEELQQKFCIRNGDLKHETPLYVILNNNKFCFMEKTIELNLFDSIHFIWMDFGINHVAKDTHHIHTWIKNVPDKIKQLCINPYIENVAPKTHFQLIYHNCAGGLFSGSKENMLKYIELFKQKTEQIYNEEWYQIDEAVMTMVQRENYELFDFFYGDYEGIISNYLKPIHSWWLINSNIEKCLNMNNTKYLYSILVYLDSYFLQEEHQSSGGFYSYITNNIICNYYQNSRKLRNVVIDLINLKMSQDDQNMRDILNFNKNNVNFYENKELINFVWV
uniref:Uncharacterized protein n=1 Tax=viral metagenome TaxID=1070528 RepID=A0A6C0IF97_9ZZZZ